MKSASRHGQPKSADLWSPRQLDRHTQPTINRDRLEPAQAKTPFLSEVVPKTGRGRHLQRLSLDLGSTSLRHDTPATVELRNIATHPPPSPQSEATGRSGPERPRKPHDNGTMISSCSLLRSSLERASLQTRRSS